MKKFGVYLHVPFCASKCAYCDFVSGVYGEDVKKAYFAALSGDITRFAERQANGRTVTSIYIGGGTPSSVDAHYLTDVLGLIGRSFVISSDCEITTEANPESLTREKAEAYARAGVNRISIGMQSASDEVLARIGRAHTSERFVRAAEIATAAVGNVSADVMLALPGQTMSDVENAVGLLSEAGMSHISVYSLKVEEGTPLQKSGYVPDEDAAADMYSLARSLLEERGYKGYEVSNFAQPGKECLHNVGYWDRSEYIGFGVSAHSFYDDTRFAVTSDLTAYLGGVRVTEKHYIPPESDEAAEETIMLALRTSRGLDLSAFRRKFGRDPIAGKESGLALLRREGLVSLTDDRLSLTPKGLYVMNEIIVRLAF